MNHFPPGKPCPCGSSKTYKECCQRFHRGTPANTPEALMRSRYSAYAIGLVDYIMDTTHPDSPHYQNDKAAWRKQLRDYTTNTHFIALHVRETTLAEDTLHGTVSFDALLSQHGQNASFSERSHFEKVQGRWLYRDGHVIKV